MEPSNTLYSNVLLLGAAHGVFLALALINVKSGDTTAHRLLALLTLTFAADLGVDYLNVSGYLAHYPRLIFVESVSSFLYGPLAYLYVQALTSSEPWHLSKRQWLHFMPFVVSVALLIPFYNLSDETLIDMIYSGADVDDQIGLWVLGALAVVVLPIPVIGAYLVCGIRRLVAHGRNIREQFSYIERISLNWLRNLYAALGALFVFYFVALLSEGDEERLESLLNIATVIVIYTIGYMGLRQPAIFTREDRGAALATAPQDIADEEPVGTDKPKYERSALDAELSKLLLDELQKLMAVDKPFLDSKLTLAQLAGQLGISSNYLSQIINQQTGNNFFDYINRHRVDIAMESLADPAQAETSILTIAMDSGFNSKSAFYTAFKQHTNLTPTQYRRNKTS